jgi:ketosteroid isomerase-like protein
MTAQDTLIMRGVAAAFQRADLRPLFHVIADSILWKSGSTLKGPFLFGGTYNERLDVMLLTAEIAAGYAFRQFAPKEITCDGNIVWGLFQVEGDYTPATGGTSKRFEFECAIRWRMEGNKVVEHQSFFDTHALLQQHS